MYTYCLDHFHVYLLFRPLPSGWLLYKLRVTIIIEFVASTYVYFYCETLNIIHLANPCTYIRG